MLFTRGKRYYVTLNDREVRLAKYALNGDSRDVAYLHRVPYRSPGGPGIFRGMYGTHLLDHLAADRAGFPGGQVTVVAVLQIHAHLP